MAANSKGAPPLLVDYQLWGNLSASPPLGFMLNAGVFALVAKASVWGTAQLQRYQPNNTYINVGAALAADGLYEFHLPSGEYILVLAGVTAFFGSLEKIGPWGGR